MTRSAPDGDGDRPRVVLVLQGGGALGAYHVGAYEAMEEAGYRPDWICGVSIGAINGSIIAGNPPEDRVAKLDELWGEISRPDGWGALLSGEFRRWFNSGSASGSFLFGQPNFFTPRIPGPLLSRAGSAGATSFYDTSPLLGTLARLASFDLINAGAVRLSLGATRVTTGDLVFFDNTRRPLAPEHVAASGSLPPSFPPVRVDGELYWDGCCVSNTPLDAVLADEPTDHTVIFMMDLWDGHGPEPTTIDEVLWRYKQIQYASQTAYHIESVARRLNFRRRLGVLADRLPREALDDPAVREALATRSDARMDIVHIIYQPAPDQITHSDSEFSRPSIAARRAAGHADLSFALERAPWSRARGETDGAVVHRLKGGRVTTWAPADEPPAGTLVDG